METAVLVGVLAAVGLLVASGVWVALVLVGTVAHIKRPAIAMRREASDGSPVAPPPDATQP